MQPCTLLTAEGRWHAPPVDVPVVDAVGAGDSFDAGLVAGMLYGLSWEESLQLGCLCGSMNTRKAGGIAGQIRKHDIRTLQSPERVSC